MTSKEPRAVVLAVHGSAHDPRCTRPIRRYAEALRDTGMFAEVVSVYWK